MTTIRDNKFFIFLLITAFLSLQWSSTHIHLAENHDHDGGVHQHEQETHNHDLAGHHIDVIDTNSDFEISHDDNNVVELEQVCASSHGKWFGQLPFISANAYLAVKTIFESIGARQSHIIFSNTGFLERPSILPRAPPRYS